MTKLLSYLKSQPYLLFLLAVLLLICIRNYTPGTYLTGWDNLHPEFHFSMNIYRSILSVWEEYQGVGLLAGMGHAADLPRQLFLYGISVFMPQSFVRYFFHFLMLVIGTTGVFFFLKHLVFLADPRKEKFALLGALFYLLNLATAQYFFLPFEPYSMFWGLFPWELFVLIRFLHSPSKSTLLWLIGVHIAATAQGYVQTIFLVYVINAILLITSFIFTVRTKTMVKNAFIALVVIFCVNAFWVLPNLYFTIHDVSITQNAINNKQNTQRFFEQNKYHGTIGDFVFLKEFYLDFYEPVGSGSTYAYMMHSWRDHFANPLIIIIGYFFFILILWGVFSHPSFLRKTHQETVVLPDMLHWYFIGLLVLSMIIFLSDTIIFAQINSLFRSLPLVNQIFRNPFTKFIVPTIFIFSIGFSLGSLLFYEYVTKRFLQKAKQQLALFIVLTILVLISGFPAFQGNLIAPQMRTAIPDDYFKLFSYFKTQDKNARIMNLPQGSYWGWGSYTWGSTGSGFLWYGIEQPIMDRAFDVWSSKLEDYYWQLWYALKKKDTAGFNAILEKYHISYVLFDTSYSPSDANPVKTLFLQQNDMLKKNPKLTLVKTFGTISVYKTHITASKENIMLKTNLPTVNSPEAFTNQDNAFTKLGFYKNSAHNQVADYLFPFGSLFTGRFQSEHHFSAKKTAAGIVLQTPLPQGNYTLTAPLLSTISPAVPITIAAKKDPSGVKLQFSVPPPTLRSENTIIPNTDVVQEVIMPTPGKSADRLILSINNQDFYVFTPQATYQVIGSTYFVNQENANTIRLYDGTKGKTDSLMLDTFDQAKECEPQNGNTRFDAHREKNLLTLLAQNTNVCSVYAGELSPLLTNALVQVRYTYTSETDEMPQYCFSTADGNGCLNQQKNAALPGFSKNGDVTDFFIIGETTSDPTFQFRLNATANEDKQKTKTLSIKNVSLTAYPVIASLVGNIPSVVSPTSIIASVDAGKSDMIHVTIPTPNTSATYPDVLDNHQFKTQATQPDSLPSLGTFSLAQLSDAPTTLRLAATNTYAQFWLHIPKNHLPTGYIMFLDTKNVHGFPLTVNIYTPDERNKYVYTSTEQPLTPNIFTDLFSARKPDFHTMYYVLPPQYPFDAGMEVLLMSSSVSNDPSINDIRNVSFYPLPYDYLTSIMLENRLHQPQKEVDLTSAITATKNSLAQYTVNLPSSLPPQSTLILSQAYHDGWQAYSMPTHSPIPDGIRHLFPGVFGTQVTEHVTINNWANGWNITATSDTASATIVLIFLPQYLQWLGFLLLAVPVGLIFKFSKSASLDKQTS